MSAESERSLPPGRIPDRRAGGRLLGAEPGAVRAFTAAWAALDDLPTTDRAARAPRIADYLPDARTLRVEALVELIRVDLRHRWLRPAGSLPDRRKRLDDYCAEFPELDRDELPAGLIYEEFVVRRHSGERLDPRDCLREYPVQAPALRELLNADDLDQSTRRARPDELGEASAPDTTLSATAPATPAADTAPGRAAAPDSGWDDDITVLAPGQPATPPVDDTTRRGPGPDPRRTPQSPPDTTVAAPDPRTATTRVASGADQPGPTDDITLLPHTGGAADTPAAEHAVNPATGPARTSDMDATAAATRAAPDATGTEATGTATAIGFDGDDRLDPLDRIRVGQRVDDFDLLTGLGSGAFARVFLARQRSMQRLVAVKISADHGTEAQTLAQLDHDYIVRVFDQRLMDSQRGTGESARRLRLLYMQFLPGGTLLGVLRWVRATPPAERSGKLLLDAVDAAMEEKGEIRPTDSSVRAEIAGLSWPETVAWLGRRLAEALAYASSHGVLHRDVKPANVLLTAEAVPKLADFNISFSRNVEGTSPVAYFGGSLAYMSPEQLEACHPGWERSAADLDTRADIFSLGVVLWELLTGAKPFDDSTAGAGRRGDDTTLEAMLERRSLGVDPAALDRVPPDCPAALRRVLLTCLEPDRERRWAGGDVLAKQLDLCLDQRARELVDPKPGSWRLRLRPWIVPVLLVAIGLPNLLASLYNIQHNQTLIVARMTEDAQRTFLIITGVVNSVFFPLGFVVVAYMSRYVLSVPRGLRRGRRYDPETLRRARCDALLLGERAVAIPFSLWVLAGLTFPLALQLSTGGVNPGAGGDILGGRGVWGGVAGGVEGFGGGVKKMR
ncbi:serine/threonine-protein kinase, partial [Nocardia farcinica]|uniref:serine/threonine-protein kinase n=1 Tax=Nocardia farcinica TaxID=37329 RepID=UPI0024557857